ncbi:hypothetical protein RintRC_0988 [Richelia intracellularis]|nr:hypothetical protein RintRC_0988 [Richelia intracellularis]
MKLRQNLFKNQESWDALIPIYHHYHWLFLFSLLVVFFGSSAIALYSLARVDTAKHEQQESVTAIVKKPITTDRDAVSPIPMWLVLAIAMSCASGCLLIVRFLHRPIRRYSSKQSVRVGRTDLATRKYKRQVKKLNSLAANTNNFPTARQSYSRNKVSRKVASDRESVRIVPQPSQLDTIPSQITPTVNTVKITAKSPLPPLLRKF